MAVENYGIEHVFPALMLYELGEVYLTRGAKGDADKAGKMYRTVITIREKILGVNNTSTINAVDRLGELYTKLRRFEEAEPLLLRALKARLKTLEEDHYLIERSYSNLADYYEQHSQEYAKAEDFYLKSIDFNEKHRSKDSYNTAISLNNYAGFLISRERYKDAEPVVRRSLELAELEAKKRPISMDVPLAKLARIHTELGRHTEAEKLLKEGVDEALKKHGETSPFTAAAMANLGEFYHRTEKLELAEEFARKVLTIRQKQAENNPIALINALKNLGIILTFRGQYAKAETIYLAVLKEMESRYEAGDPRIAEVLTRLGSLYMRISLYDKAEKQYQRALAIRESFFGKDKGIVAQSLTDLGNIAMRREEYDKAEKLFLQAIDIFERTIAKDCLQLAHPLNSLAVLRAEAKGAVELELYQRIEKIYAKHRGPDDTDALTSLLNLGLGYKAAKRPGDADPMLRKCVAGLTRRLGASHPNTVLAMHHLATNSYALGKVDEARELMDKVRRHTRSYVTSVLPSLTPELQRQFLHSTDNGVAYFAFSIAMANAKDQDMATASAAWLANSKGTIHEVQSISAQLAKVGDSPSATKLRKLHEELTQLSISDAGAKDAETGKRREALSGEIHKLEFVLRESGSRVVESLTYVELADIRKKLTDKSVLIDITQCAELNVNGKKGEKNYHPAHYVAWVTPKTGAVKVVDLGEADVIDKLVAAARKDLNAAEKTIINDGEPIAEKKTRAVLLAVAEKALHPILKEIGDANELIISPDGSLWLMPWSAMPLPNGKYAVESFRIRNVVSGRDLVLANSKVKPSSPIIIADPDYDLDPADAAKEAKLMLGNKTPGGADTRGLLKTLNLGQVQRLQGTAVEAKFVAPSLEKWLNAAPRVLTDKQALKSVVKTAKGPEALIISTHGFFQPDQEVEANDSAGLVTSLKRDVKVAGNQPYQDPLTRCGLLFAACNTQKNNTGPVVDDGLLTGLEVVNCDFRGTKLVVLSACETGLGDVKNGEGVAGLRQAFQLAGAETIIATLWQIPDTASAKLVVAFFDYLAKGTGRSEGLQAAQRDIIATRRDLKNAAHPYYWAGFTVTGQEK